jgi:hypothetical protein
MRGALPTVVLSVALGTLIGLALAWALLGRGELRYRDLPVVEAPLPPSAAAAIRGPLGGSSWRSGHGRSASPAAA